MDRSPRQINLPDEIIEPLAKYVNSELQKSFEYIRETFFPKWDQERQWKVSHRPDLLNKFPDLEARVEIDLCEIRFFFIRVKKATLSEIVIDYDALYGLLVHEVCHVETGGGHTAKWLLRMIDIYQLASRIKPGLAARLKDHIRFYAGDRLDNLLSDPGNNITHA